MDEDLRHIHVFKTNISSDADRTRVSELFSDPDTVEDLYVDMEDRDRVLRIVSHELRAEEIIKQVTRIGFQCQELQ